MGIYIKGMEMPKSCGECLEIGWQYVFECNLDDVEEGEKLSTCPLVPVPPHGRGIDADALLNKHFGKMYFEKVMTATKEEMNIALTNIPLVINNAPTIIEAEEGE